jgi:threonine/homoserine/homoserine lactone efflux protein
MTLEFFLTSLIVVVSPGTGAIFTLATGLSQGARASVLAAFASTLGVVPHMIAAITGLAALLHTSALAFEMVKYLGVAYLLYMAYSTLREDGALQITSDAPAAPLKVIVHGIMINLLNPKLSIFFVAFLPQFIAPADPAPLTHMIGLSLIFMAMTFAVFSGYGVFAASVRHHVTSRPSVLRWMRRSFAAAFVGLGMKLALTSR